MVLCNEVLNIIKFLMHEGKIISQNISRGVDHPPSSSSRVTEREELYLYSPSGLHGPF
jgi:hypothetical protein